MITSVEIYGSEPGHKEQSYILRIDMAVDGTQFRIQRREHDGSKMHIELTQEDMIAVQSAIALLATQAHPFAFKRLGA